MSVKTFFRNALGLTAGQFFRSRQKASEVAKTLAFVIPLTLLIWIYAERAQIGPDVKAPVLFKVSIAEPTLHAEIVEPKSSPITVSMSGPRAAVDRLKADLERQANAGQLNFQLPNNYAAGTEPVISVVELLNGDPDIRASGVTITEAVPATIKLMIDKIVQKDFDVRLPSNASKNLQNVIFEPRVVSLRGPETIFDLYFTEYGEGVTVDLSGFTTQLETPGPHVLERVPLVLPKGLPKDSVSMTPTQLRTMRFDVSRSEAEYTIPSVTIDGRTPLAMIGKFTVQTTPRTIFNVRVRGPVEQIEKLKVERPDAIRPVAMLQIQQEDLTKGEGRRNVQIVDLPPGVTVVDAPREVDFTVRATTDGN